MKKPLDGVSTSKSKLSLFLSYAREDHAKVLVIYKRLRDAGFHPWIDTEDLRPGARWEQAIFKAITAADIFLVVLSDNSVSKRGVLQREIRAALKVQEEKLEGDVYIIPVRLGHCNIPAALAKFQAADIDTDEGWTKLLDSLHLQYSVLRGAGLRGMGKEQLAPHKVIWKGQPYLTVSGFLPNSEGALRAAKFGTKDSAIAALAQRGLGTMIAQFYGLVPEAIGSPRCIFQGLRNSTGVDNTILVYASKPELDVVWDDKTSSLRSMPNVAQHLFRVLVKLDGHKSKAELLDATIENWNWVREDSVLKGAPAAWQERFGKLVWRGGS